MLHPPPAPPPDPKLLALQARVQADQVSAQHQAQILQQKAQNEALHLQVKTQAEIELAKIKAELDAKMAVLDAQLKAANETRKVRGPAIPGAQKAMDGHHYVADPKRAGKFLRVMPHAG